MSIKLSDSIRVGQQKPLEDKYFNELVPYTSINQVNTLLPKSVRHIGLTVNINGDEYWYKDGIEDSNLVLKVPNIDTFILKNQEQDDRLENLEGSNYVWSPTNRTLTLYDRGGTQLSQVSLVSLDNEGTDLRYNPSTLSLDLYNTNNELLDSIPVSSFVGSVGTQLQLNSNELQLKDSQGNILSTVSFTISNIQGLQTDLILENYYLKSEIDTFNNNNYLYINQKISDYDAQIQTQFGDYYNKIGIDALLYSSYYTKSETYNQTEINGFLSGKQNTIGYTPENVANKSDSYTASSSTTYASTKALVDGLDTKLDKGVYTETAQDLKNEIDTKADLVGGKIPASQLPAYVDDVLEFANLASFPATGESGKIYIAIDTNLTYRWGGSSYVVMSSSLALGETESTAYRGDRGQIAYEHSQKTIGNPHNTKVEELTDVSGDTASIEDTDVILKKETGGLWKKITFANFKSWFTTELAKKINIGLDTIFNFKNISAMPLNEFRSITPDIETIYFTEEQNSTGWQQVRYNSNLSIGYQALTESVITINSENFIELDSDSSFNLIDVENTKIKGIFENDFMIITFSAKVDTPSTPNQWFKLILKVNGVQAAVSPVFYLLEPAGMPERISHSFALKVPAEMVTHGATLHIKPSVTLILNSHSLTATRVHKSTNANL